MPITVLSPHNGHPVKIRDADVGRAVRDSDGRLFYTVERPDGGYYAAVTRKGSPRCLERYERLERGEELLPRTVASADTAAPVAPNRAAAATGPIEVHDARGRRRVSPLRALILLLVLIGVVLAGWLGYQWLGQRGWLPDGAPTLPRLPLPGDGSPGNLEPPSGPADLLDPGELSAGPGWRLVRASADTDPFHWSASGLGVRVDRLGRGPAAVAGTFAIVSYTLVHEPTGLVVDRTPEGEPTGFVVWSGTVPRGLDEAVAGMRIGERRTAVIPTALLGRGDAREAGVEADRLVAHLELLNVMPGVRRTVLEAGGTGTRTADKDTAGVDTMVRPGDTVRLRWSVQAVGRHLLSSGETPVEVVVGSGRLVQGLELGLLGLRQGQVARVEVPPYLAYGARGAAGGVVPPHATLVCVVEVVEVVREAAGLRS